MKERILYYLSICASLVVIISVIPLYINGVPTGAPTYTDFDLVLMAFGFWAVGIGGPLAVATPIMMFKNKKIEILKIVYLIIYICMWSLWLPLQS